MNDYNLEGGAICSGELDSVMDDLEETCRNYFSNDISVEIRNEDFGVGVYWNFENQDRYVLLTPLKKDSVYIAVGTGSEVDEKVTGLCISRLKDIEPALDAARGAAEGLDINKR